ncbi:Zinc finger MYND domain-containing protein [Perkinsela sp. CCAP 1560/4]|nr:Zinc finger MYND domain-containing protein [Perkinsela sp. CCAP 1560/4]|eukprot:KNH08047.1 Zinc finger MYND domain-containing protein [Perkinsela sp. CCAP 1560/4]
MTRGKASVRSGYRDISTHLQASEARWPFPSDLPESDVCLSDNVLISEFPKLNSCGSIVHEKGSNQLGGDDQVSIGIDCCGVCARDHQERFRCKKCQGVVYCSVAHQAADRGFHATVCQALQVVECDRQEDDLESELHQFLNGLFPCPLPEYTESIAEYSLEEVFHRFLFEADSCSEWKCLQFLHGTPLGRAFMDHASFPLTLWSQWGMLPKRTDIVVHVIGASRSECQFPALWSLMLPRGETRGLKEIAVFGPDVPKSLHAKAVHGSLKFYRMKYHNAINRLGLQPPHVVFAPAMGATSSYDDWEETFTVMEKFLQPGTVIITTCYSEEEMHRESQILIGKLHWRQLCEPFLNPFASTRIQQNLHIANDIYRSNYIVCAFLKR